jgi:N utilization substance protein B
LATPSSKGPSKARLARELALRLLFQLQASGQGGPEECLRLFEQSFSPENDQEAALELSPDYFGQAWPKARALFLGAASRLEELDRDISAASLNWSLERMDPVDLALMRLAWYEMRFSGVPPKVSLNEAIEMAKGFGSPDSASFVNGVLDKLMSRMEASGR